jgi:hypothetical protein
MANKQWKVINPADETEFECTARTRKLAYDAARDAGFIQVVNGIYRGMMNYVIQPLQDEPPPP